MWGGIGVHVEVRDQSRGIGFLPPCRTHGLNSGPETCQQAPLLTEPSCCPLKCFFFLGGGRRREFCNIVLFGIGFDIYMFILFFLHWVINCVCVLWCACGSQRSSWVSQFSPSTIQDPGVGPEIWQQASFPAEPSCWPWVLILYLMTSMTRVISGGFLSFLIPCGFL